MYITHTKGVRKKEKERERRAKGMKEEDRIKTT